MYDPTLGRFTGTDPDPAGAAVPAIEAYDYAGQDPVRNLDPNGERLFAEGGLEPGISTSCGKYGGQSCAGTEGNAEEPIEQTVDRSMKEVRSAVTKVALSVVNNPDLQLAALTCVGMAVKTEGPPIAKGAACVVSGATVYFFGVNLLEPASADSSEGKRRPGRAGWKPLP